MENIKETAMKTVLNIEGMSCQNCVRHVKEALEAVSGVKSVEVDLAGKSAAVEHGDEATFDTLKAAVEDAGYEIKC